MKTSVGINAKNRKDFVAQLLRAKSDLPKGAVLHIDVSDPDFSNIKSYFNAGELKKYSDYFEFEAHLMVPSKKLYLNKFWQKPLKKVWVHSSQVGDWNKLLAFSKKHKINVGVAVGFNEPFDFSPRIRSILALTVKPGPSGQKFGAKSLKLISFLRKKYPRATITVDGGITPQITKIVKGKGASGVVSTSYIWRNKDPKKAYFSLKKS